MTHCFEFSQMTQVFVIVYKDTIKNLIHATNASLLAVPAVLTIIQLPKKYVIFVMKQKISI